MKKFMVQYVKKHKIASLALIIILIGAGFIGYNKYKSSNVKPTYITSTIEKGTLIISVSSSGQISASNQVDIKAKVSGDITKITVASGQEVKAGDLIAQINAKDAYKTVRDAASGLAGAQLAMDKLKQAADTNSVLQSENALASAKNSLAKLKLSQPIDYQAALDAKKKAEDGLSKTYEDAFNTISNAYLNLPTIVTKLNDILYSKEIGTSEATIGQSYGNIADLANSIIDAPYNDKIYLKSFQMSAENDYKIAQEKYINSFVDYKNASRYSDRSVIESLLAETLEVTKLIAQSVKSESNYLDAWANLMSELKLTIFSKVKEYQTNLATYIGQTNGHLSSLLSVQSLIKDDNNAIISAENNIKEMDQNNPLDLKAAEASAKEKQASLAKLKAGADPLDIRSQELSLQQKRNSLYDAQSVLADYTIRAPFDGLVGAVKVKVGDSASGAIITAVMTKQHLAEISLNEVDVAKIKIGDKATLTFDALSGLNISGQAAEIDASGAVTNGVVTYNVKIVFDTQDSRVKSGMSTNATIITDVKTDVLMAPNAAVKTDANGASFVQTLDSAGRPQNIAVQIGLANDTNTEIVSGLNEGDKVITQTINPSAASANPATQQSGGLRIPGITGGGAGGGGNNFRRIGN